MRKGAEGARCEVHLNSQVKGLLPDRTLESFIQKSTDGAIPILVKINKRDNLFFIDLITTNNIE